MGGEADNASMSFAPATHKQIRDATHLSFALLAVRLPRHSFMLARYLPWEPSFSAYARKLAQFHAFGIYCSQTVLRGVQTYLHYLLYYHIM